MTLNGERRRAGLRRRIKFQPSAVEPGYPSLDAVPGLQDFAGYGDYVTARSLDCANPKLIEASIWVRRRENGGGYADSELGVRLPR